MPKEYKYWTTIDPLPGRDDELEMGFFEPDVYMNPRDAAYNIEPGEMLYEVTVVERPGMSLRVPAYDISWSDRGFSWETRTASPHEPTLFLDRGYELHVGPVFEWDLPTALREAAKRMRRHRKTVSIVLPTRSTVEDYIAMLPQKGNRRGD